MDLWLYILLLVVLLLLRVPVAFAMIASSMLYFYSHGLSPGYAISSIVNGINSFPLLAVPLFIFVGTIANHLGIATRLYDFARALLPRLPGNLAYVNLGTAIGFSWISGSALADAASTSKVQIPQMLKAGLPVRLLGGAHGIRLADEHRDAAEHPRGPLRRDGVDLHRRAVRRARSCRRC